MMRAWENRPDTVVVDEPLYAAYLARTGIDHPVREEVIASQPTDLAAAVAALSVPLPPGRSIRLAAAWHAPRLPRDGPALDAALPQRVADPRPSRSRGLVCAGPGDLRAGRHRPAPAGVADEALGRARHRCTCHRRDFLRAPEQHLRWLCDWLGIPFSTRMLSWPPGPRASDGVWAPHWYAAVWSSTGFEPWRPRETTLSDHDATVAEACRPIYTALHARRARF